MPPETIDSLDDDLKSMVLRIVAQNASLLGSISELLVQNKALLARIAELEAKLGMPPKTPDNSSLPPSRGHKANVDVPPQKKQQQRKGRPGVARELSPNPDITRNIAAERCPCCKQRVTATAPADMPEGSPFGPNIAAHVAYLHGCQLMSFKRLTEALDGLFGLTISQGAIANMLVRVGKPFAQHADKMAATVRASDVIASDETSARVKGKTWWQWTFGCATAVYHVIEPTRGKCVPTGFLGQAKPKVWLSDRLAAQCTLAEAHQFCLAHLLRDAQYAIDHGDAIFAPQFKAFLKDACAVGRRRPDLTDATIAMHRRRLKRVLDRFPDLEATDAEGRHLRDTIYVTACDKLLVFLNRRDVEPTNNESERELRPSVIFRKVTNGFRSEWGAKVYADLCSIVGTGSRNGRSAIAAIRDALAAPAAASSIRREG